MSSMLFGMDQSTLSRGLNKNDANALFSPKPSFDVLGSKEREKQESGEVAKKEDNLRQGPEVPEQKIG